MPTLEWFDRYWSQYPGAAWEEGLFRDVQAVAEQTGALDRDTLVRIAKWKAVRASGYMSSDAKRIEVTTRTAISGPEELAVHTLTYLEGVGVRMASAIMTAVRPQTFTVYDVLAHAALKELKVGWDYRNRDFGYWSYVQACHRLADQLGVSLRDLDRALWAYGKGLSSQEKAP